MDSHREPLLKRDENEETRRPESSETMPPLLPISVANREISASSAISSASQLTMTIPSPTSERAFQSVFVTNVAVGNLHSVILTNVGRLFAFGSNAFGQLALPPNGGVAESEEPVEIRNFPNNETGAGGILKLACGAYHTLCVNSEGEMFAWGRDNLGQLGSGTKRECCHLPSFVMIPGGLGEGDGVKEVAGGEAHSACVTKSGRLYTWGDGSHGKLGLGLRKRPSATVSENPVDEGECETTPRLVTFWNADEKIANVSCGVDHTLVLTSRGNVMACGAGFYGRLGTGRIENEYEFRRISLPGAVSSVSAGNFHSLCVLQNGEVYAWGRGDFRLGQGSIATAEDCTTPRRVFFPSLVIATTDTTSSGGRNTDAVDADSLLLTNRGATSAARKILTVVAGEDHSFALDDAGGVWAWGSNRYRKLGLPLASSSSSETSTTAVPERLGLGFAIRIASLSTKTKHVIALSREGRVFGWGCSLNGRLVGANWASADGRGTNNNMNGELGRGPFEMERFRPVRPLGGMNASEYRQSAVKSGLGNAFLPPVIAATPSSFSAISSSPSGEEGNAEWGFLVDEVCAAFANEGRVPGTLAEMHTFLNACRCFPQIEPDNLRTARLRLREDEDANEELMERVAKSRDVCGHLTGVVRVCTRRALESVGGAGSCLLPAHLSSSFPSLRRILSLLLIQPRWMARLHEEFCAGGGDTEEKNEAMVRCFEGLVRDLYRVDDGHSERLFARLARVVLRREMMRRRGDDVRARGAGGGVATARVIVTGLENEGTTRNSTDLFYFRSSSWEARERLREERARSTSAVAKRPKRRNNNSVNVKSSLGKDGVARGVNGETEEEDDDDDDEEEEVATSTTATPTRGISPSRGGNGTSSLDALSPSIVPLPPSKDEETEFFKGVDEHTKFSTFATMMKDVYSVGRSNTTRKWVAEALREPLERLMSAHPDAMDLETDPRVIAKLLGEGGIDGIAGNRKTSRRARTGETAPSASLQDQEDLHRLPGVRREIDARVGRLAETGTVVFRALVRSMASVPPGAARLAVKYVEALEAKYESLYGKLAPLSAGNERGTDPRTFAATLVSVEGERQRRRRKEALHLAGVRLLFRAIVSPALSDPRCLEYEFMLSVDETRANALKTGMGEVARFVDLALTYDGVYTEPYLLSLNSVLGPLRTSAQTGALAVSLVAGAGHWSLSSSSVGDGNGHASGSRPSGSFGREEESSSELLASAELACDLAMEHLRARPLVVFPTRRTLEFLRYACGKIWGGFRESNPGGGEVKSSNNDEDDNEFEDEDNAMDGEREMIKAIAAEGVGLLSNAEKEMRALDFANHSFDDEALVSLDLDLRFLFSSRGEDEVEVEEGESERRTRRVDRPFSCWVDSLTGTPVPRFLADPHTDVPFEEPTEGEFALRTNYLEILQRCFTDLPPDEETLFARADGGVCEMGSLETRQRLHAVLAARRDEARRSPHVSPAYLREHEMAVEYLPQDPEALTQAFAEMVKNAGERRRAALILTARQRAAYRLRDALGHADEAVNESINALSAYASVVRRGTGGGSQNRAAVYPISRRLAGAGRGYELSSPTYLRDLVWKAGDVSFLPFSFAPETSREGRVSAIVRTAARACMGSTRSLVTMEVSPGSGMNDEDGEERVTPEGMGASPHTATEQKDLVRRREVGDATRWGGFLRVSMQDLRRGGVVLDSRSGDVPPERTRAIVSEQRQRDARTWLIFAGVTSVTGAYGTYSILRVDRGRRVGVPLRVSLAQLYARLESCEFEVALGRGDDVESVVLFDVRRLIEMLESVSARAWLCL